MRILVTIKSAPSKSDLKNSLKAVRVEVKLMLL